MKNILISCVSIFSEKFASKPLITYSSEDITVDARQTNEACAKFLMKKLSRDGNRLDAYIRVQSNAVEKDSHTMKYLNESISELCGKENIAVPENYDLFLREDEQEHRYDRVLSEISEKVLSIADNDPQVSIYLDMAGGKRDNYIFIQLLTKLLSFYNYDIHTYYADITENKDRGTIVNTDLSFRHMEILDAVNVFLQFGSATSLRKCFANTKDPNVKALLKAMEDFSNSLQLCSTDLANEIKLLNQQIDQTEKYVSYDKDDLFVIGTMLPLIRRKFDIFEIKADNSSKETLNIIKWCLKNDMIQQALTIYHERIADLIIDNKFIVIDEEYYKNDIKKKMKNVHKSKRNSVLLRLFTGLAFENMYNAPTSGTAEMKNIIGKYKGNNKNPKRDDSGNIDCHNFEWTVGSVFFEKKFLPDHMTINIDDGLLRNILSDISFSNGARNRVNHASETDKYSKEIVTMFGLNSYPFSSYPNTFTPKNVKKDLLRAVKNLEEALDLAENKLITV